MEIAFNLNLKKQAAALVSATKPSNNSASKKAATINKNANANAKADARKAAARKMQLELIAGCVAEDRIYQKRLYETYYGQMMGICLRYTGNYEEARDVITEGFMKVYKNIAKFQPNHSLASWIKRIMINTAIDHYRRNKKHRHQVDLAYAANEIDGSTYSVLHQLSADEIMKLVKRLTPAYRTVFNLYVVEGYKHKDIAALLGISEGTSKSNLAKARMKLRSMIAKELPEYASYF